MTATAIIDFAFRWLHVLFGITWIGMLYYFNFVQTEYFKEAEAGAKADAVQKLAPRALWWFRWSAMMTFLTGLVMLEIVRRSHGIDAYIVMGAVLGILMFLNVWLIIWPKQKIVCGLAEGDSAAAGAKAALASRTNTLFSGPMLLGMLGSWHGVGPGLNRVTEGGFSLGLWIVLGLIALLEINAIVGKPGPMSSIVGVIHGSIALVVIFFALLAFV